MAGGRPRAPAFKDKETLKKAIDKFFEDNAGKTIVVDGKEQPYPLTMTGLAMALGVCRETLINYQKTDEFFHTIKSAKTRVEHYVETNLFTKANVTGSIFALKNLGWVDKSERDVNHGAQDLNGGSVKIEWVKQPNESTD